MNGLPGKNCSKSLHILKFTVIAVLVLSGFIILDDLYWHFGGFSESSDETITVNLGHIKRTLPIDGYDTSPRNCNCTLWDCLNLYRCGQGGHAHLTVYVYPLQEYVDISSGKLAFTYTQEYYDILEAVVHSSYYTSNPNDACLFLISIDMLNQNLIEPLLASRALSTLDYWENGENHILFNMLPGSVPEYNRVLDVNTSRAIILGGGFDAQTFRFGFDVPLPVWSPALQNLESTIHTLANVRKYKLIIAQLNIVSDHLHIIDVLSQEYPIQILLLQRCHEATKTLQDTRCTKEMPQRQYNYPSILLKGTFCLLSRGQRLGQPDLVEMLAYNCIPVIAIDSYILPFGDVLDWSLATVHIREADLHLLMQRLKSISHKKMLELRQQGRWLFNNYFHDLKVITLTALEILEGRIFPHRARNIYQWNSLYKTHRFELNPLFLPAIAPKSQGFTAVILSYDRLQSLFTLIQKLALVPSLQGILVIWNNQRKSPPLLSSYPTILKPLKVIRTHSNKLSNRFYPYAEIETEAILTIDDDIVMLTADELDFGFEVWREFPDRIVGFPSRIHVWNNESMSWHYESEWTNRISMVLTGAAFHHKFWSYMYTHAMPGDIKLWVDNHMNCEDIAMNFLVANITKKPPIKVTPRKKFKCPECINTEMLSANLYHMRERSTCIDRFARIYGRIPLRGVEFRADPVLFKDNFPEKLKRFNDIGNL